MENKALHKDSRLWTLLGIIAFLFFHHFCGYFGHYGFDDIMGYGFYAKKWADGQLFYLDENFFSYRWGFIAPTGFFYQVFGMGDGAAAIFPSLVLLLTVLLIFRILKGEERLVGVVGVLLYAFDNWTMYYSDKLMPDTTVALATFAAFYLIHQVRFVVPNTSTLKYAIALASVLLFGYMSKQSILLLAPVFFILMSIDLSQKRLQRFWLESTLSCIVLGFLYLLLVYIITGNPLARFLAVEAGLEDNLGEGHAFAFCNYAVQPISVLLYRISFEMIERALSAGLMFSIMLAIPALLTHKIKALFYNETQQSYWSLVLILSALSANFMTTSYKAYLPICPDIRHFLFLVPIAAVVAAPVLTQFAKEKQLRFSYIIVTLLMLALAKYCQLGNMEYLYLGAFLAIFLRSFLPNHHVITWGFLVALLMVALMPILSSMHSSNQNGYVEQRALIYKYFKGSSEKSLVYTNIIQRNFGNYLLEFEEDAHCKFYAYNEINKTNSADRIVYILSNKTTEQMSHLDKEQLPNIIQQALTNKKQEGLEIIYKSEKITLWKLKNKKLLLE